MNLSKSQESVEAGVDDVYYPTLKWFEDVDYIMKNSNVTERPKTTNMVSIQ